MVLSISIYLLLETQSTKLLTTQMLEAGMELGCWDIGLSAESFPSFFYFDTWSLYTTLTILEFNM